MKCGMKDKIPNRSDDLDRYVDEAVITDQAELEAQSLADRLN
jgi:hypothetical protein